MKKMLIFGCSPYSQYIRYVMEHDANIITDAYCMSQSYIKENEFDGRPVYPFEQLRSIYGQENFQILISVGYRNMNQEREKIFHQCDELGYEIASFIHPSVMMEAESIGRGNIIMENSMLCAFTQIGDGNILTGAGLGHHSKMGNFNFTAKCSIAGCVEIGNNCFIGIGCVINDKVKIADFNLLGSGTAITKDTRPYSLIAAAKNRIVQTDIEFMDSLFH